MQTRVLLGDLNGFAQAVLAQLPAAHDRAVLIALQGDLGAGKTTFVQALAQALGVHEPVQSPTYVLMKSYPISYKEFTKLVHIDAYRLDDPGQFAALKPESFLSDSHALVCVEWPEKAEGALPRPDLLLKFSSDGVPQGERYIEIV
jgi:tRNA threonylcarbamoyladenosine biosynthesis protein TsaE